MTTTKRDKLAARRRIKMRRQIAEALDCKPIDVVFYRRLSAVQQKVIGDLADHPFSNMVLRVPDDKANH